MLTSVDCCTGSRRGRHWWAAAAVVETSSGWATEAAVKTSSASGGHWQQWRHLHLQLVGGFGWLVDGREVVQNALGISGDITLELSIHCGNKETGPLIVSVYFCAWQWQSVTISHSFWQLANQMLLPDLNGWNFLCLLLVDYQCWLLSGCVCPCSMTEGQL